MVEGIRASLDEVSLRADGSSALYQSLFEDSYSIMLVIHPDSGRIIEANRAASAYYGYSKEQLAAMRISDINVQTSAQIFEEMQNAKSEKRKYFLFQHRLRNGDIRDVEVYSSPVIINGKNILYSVIHDITERNRREKEREKLINDLESALAEIKTLKGILPICASCKKIRDDEGYWNQIESYIRDHSEAEFTHGICPECARKLYPEAFEE